MSQTFTEAHRLGDIVVQFPQASEIFKRHGIDFCCGGEQRLEEAVEEHGVNKAAVLEELNQSYSEALAKGIDIVDWASVPLRDLVHHIVNTHHAYLQQTFPPLTALVVKILRVHGQHHGEVLRQVHRLFNQLRMEMEEHMIKEEEYVFPQIVEFENHPSRQKLESVIATVQELDAEHDTAGDLVKELRRVTNHYALPADACGTYTKVFEELQTMESDIFQHIHLENNVLFVRLKNTLLAYSASTEQ